jgi:hypothetical protein
MLSVPNALIFEDIFMRKTCGFIKRTCKLIKFKVFFSGFYLVVGKLGIYADSWSVRHNYRDHPYGYFMVIWNLENLPYKRIILDLGRERKK